MKSIVDFFRNSARCARIYRVHRGLVVVAGVGSALIFVVVASLICVTVSARAPLSASLIGHFS